MADDIKWEVRHDESSGQAYYVNLVTGESSWDPPNVGTLAGRSASTSESWTEVKDENGRSYYVNLETMETAWDAPAFHAVAMATGDGSVRVDSTIRPSTAEQMDQLNALLSGGVDDDGDPDQDGPMVPQADQAEVIGDAEPPVAHPSEGIATTASVLEWMMFLNESDGVPYYYNDLTGECVWEPPAAFLEYHAQSASAERTSLIGPGEENDKAELAAHRSARASSASTPPEPPGTSAPAIPPITPEFEAKVKRAIEVVSKTPVGTGRLTCVLTPTVNTRDGGSTARVSSRPQSSSGSERQRLVGVSDGEPLVEASASPTADGGVVVEVEATAEAPMFAVGEAFDGVESQRIVGEDDTECQERQSIMIQLAVEESALIIQCLVRCFSARRRAAQKRKAQAKKTTVVTELASENGGVNPENGEVTDQAAVEMPQELQTDDVRDSDGLADATDATGTAEPSIESEASLQLTARSARTEEQASDVDEDSQLLAETAELFGSVAETIPTEAHLTPNMELDAAEHKLHQESSRHELDMTADVEAVTSHEETLEADAVQTLGDHAEGDDEISKANASRTEEVQEGTSNDDLWHVSDNTDDIQPTEGADADKTIPTHSEKPVLMKETPFECSPTVQQGPAMSVTQLPQATPPEPVAKRSARQDHSSRRQEEGRVPNVPRISSIDPDKGCLAVLNVCSFFPSRLPHKSILADLDMVKTNVKANTVQTAISSKPAQHGKSIIHQQKRKESVKQRTERPEPRERTTTTEDSVWEETLAYYQEVFSSSVARFSNERTTAQATESARRESALQELARQRADQRHTEKDGRQDTVSGRMSVWEVVEELGRVSDDNQLRKLKEILQHAVSAEGFVDAMMCERLRAMSSAVDRLRKSGKTDRASFWEEVVNAYRKGDDGTWRHPYWKRLHDKLHATSIALNHDELAHELLNRRSSYLDSLLHIAAWNGNLQLVELIVREWDADVNAVDCSVTKTTPLHEACRGGHLSVVDFLLSHGAFLDVVDQQGETPLHVACRLGWSQVVHKLIAAGESEDMIMSHCTLVENGQAAAKTRTLRSMKWKECFLLRNSKQRRAAELATLPSLVEFLNNHTNRLGKPVYEELPSERFAGAATGASGQSANMREANRKNKPSNSRPTSAGSTKSSSAVVIHAR